jgi:hypothetical protein
MEQPATAVVGLEEGWEKEMKQKKYLNPTFLPKKT